MFDEKDIKTYLLIRKGVKANKWLSFLFIVFSFICPVFGWAPFDIPPSNMPLIGSLFGVQFLFYNTPKYGAEAACSLIQKAINRDTESLTLYAELKKNGKIENA
ncbi:hypothetical protein [Teredinibacter haidensis]|uniref:hypothetical protein n=1 Tax=Teredinibacter haidensis TaxID=2731755 RepID=UPI000948998C|nr:hypothetical protein [Teredinibacter haidensis]